MTTLLLIPLLTSIVCYLLRNARLIGSVSLAGSIALAAAAFPVIAASLERPLGASGDMFYMDALSGYIMAIVIFLSLASSGYSISYLKHELDAGLTDLRGMRRYYSLFHLFVLTMLLVTMGNNLAVMWIAIEATTIVSALLIGLGFYKRPLAIEAAWKYIILCTVGITFALLGTFIAYYASTTAMGVGGTLNWTVLRAEAARLNPGTMKLAFIFVLVGYGTKAGLAPMHNWLPDAHSQAPAPVSALFSGFMLNAGLYCVMRFLPIVDALPGGLGSTLLLVLGALSLMIGAGFILFQHDAKRLLAYCSVEHVGLIALGLGLGPLGVAAALFHSLNHSLAKCLAFFAVGRLGQASGGHAIVRLSGAFRVSPLWGVGLLGSFLALAGVAPAASFLSEVLILKAAFDAKAWWALAALLAGLAVAFVGMMRHTIRLAWARSEGTVAPLHTGWLEPALVVAPLVLLVAFALVLPQPLADLISDAARSVSGSSPSLFAGNQP
jgi:hydrogenase-4 component F